MIITQKAINRRTVLRGIGTTLLLPLLDSMLTGGLVSLEEVRILRYGPNESEVGSSAV